MLPGLLVLEYSMGDERSYQGGATFISFSPLLNNPRLADSLLEEVKQSFERVANEMQSKGVGLERALQNLQLKPGLWGVGYDFKPHVISLIKRLRHQNESKQP